MAALHLLVRTVHVLGMVVLLGGSAFTWNALRAGRADALPVRYEWLFWGTMGAMLVTGVGNLGALGAPGPTTRWGSLLTVKLALVLAFVLGSALRTLVVCRLRTRGAVGDTTDALGRMYGTTAAVLVVVVVLAEVLSHG
jgi:uncharacterized membrane protein